MSDIALPPALDRVRALDPALAESLGEDLARLSRAGQALAWAQGWLPALLSAPGERAALLVVVEAARQATGAPRAWALTWRGDLASGRASFEALAGDGVQLEAPPQISRTVVGQVASLRRPLWSTLSAQGARFQAAESVQALVLRSVGCVPVGDHGVLWLEDPQRSGRFAPGMRLQVAALCALAGRVFEARRSTVLPAAVAAAPVEGLVGSAPAMQELYGAIRAFAPMPWPALVLGETGTGKEAVARALHALSPRGRAPFVAVNCGAIVETLAESTLFGNERGAFTGADRRSDGLLGRVGEGTLFLDEVGELSPALQVKLLRLLQEGAYERVGGREPLRFTGRVIAATHRHLDDPGRRGAFREDLYYRLAAGTVRVPPLRDRRSDVPDLARHLLARAAAELSLPSAPLIEAEALAELSGRAWAGNVRELENTLRGALALALARNEGRITWADLVSAGPARRPASPPVGRAPADAAPVAAPPPAPLPGDGIDADLDLQAATEAFQQARVRAALADARGNRSAAARRLGVSRQWLHRLLSRWDAVQP